jgi:hypothetical protein
MIQWIKNRVVKLSVTSSKQSALYFAPFAQYSVASALKLLRISYKALNSKNLLSRGRACPAFAGNPISVINTFSTDISSLPGRFRPSAFSL